MPAPSPCKCSPVPDANRAIEPNSICSVCGGAIRATSKSGPELRPDLLPLPVNRRINQTNEVELARLQLNLQRSGREAKPEVRLADSGAETPRGNQRPDRRVSYLREQRKLCRLLGIAVSGWALFSLLPGGVAWQRWLGGEVSEPLPLWIPLFAAFGSTPLLLGLLLNLVPDWTTLKSGASGLLAVACGYAFAGSLAALARPEHRWLGSIQFPFSDTGAATLWCLSMMILAGILSLLCFLEGQRWRRIEQLLDEIGSPRNLSLTGRL